MSKQNLRNHNDVLEAIAEAIDIPEHLDEIARKRYASIGEWLDRPKSSIKQLDPEVSPQGSFLLGTVIRPIGDADEYDLDLVCTLKGLKSDFTMEALKTAVGTELKAYAEANSMKHEPKDGRRCWTMEYADQAQFHMDILPSLPDEETYRKFLESRGYVDLAANPQIRELAIAITDKTHPQYQEIFGDWPISNPKGYALWFNSRQSNVLMEYKRKIVEDDVRYASVDDVPNYRVKTPLQRSIQLLKRHRDTMFAGDDDKPISIIITTLSAHAYNGERTIDQALRTILRNMDDNIAERNGVKWVANPVNPEENFADKWPETPRKEANFYKWLEQAQRDFGAYVAGSHVDIPDLLQERMSETTIQKVVPHIAAVAAPAVVPSSSAGEAEAAKVTSEGRATKPWSW